MRGLNNSTKQPPDANLRRFFSFKISWTGVSSAVEYQIHRATSVTGTYYCKVQAYHLEGTTKVYGTYSIVKYLNI